MLRKIIRFIRELFVSYDLSDEEREFIELNRKQWNIEYDKKIGILVEGLLSSPTSIVEKSRLANVAREVIGVDAKVIVRGVSRKNSNVIPIYRSFGFSDFCLWWMNYVNPLVLVPSILSCLYVFFVIRNGCKLVKYQKNGILIGDLVYDSIVRNVPNSYTINNLSPFFHGRLIFRSMVFFYGNRKLLKHNDIKAVVTSHNVYAEFGMLCRQAHAAGAVILLKDMDVYKLYDQRTSITEHFLKVDGDIVEREFYNSDLEKEINYFNSRVLGNSKQIDVENAYKNKKIYSKDEAVGLHEGFDSSKACVFVMAHAFSDAPHVGGGLLFKDYYDFLEKTLVKLELNENINCFVKSHPSSYMWGESGGVEEIVEKNKLCNICILPPDFNTASTIDIADVIVTAKGTAGLEFSCAGIPAITAGEGYYQGFGICHEPASLGEYYNLLAECHTLKRLDKEKVRMALVVLYQSFNRLFHSDVLPAVQILPGDNYQLLFKSKFHEMSNNLKNNKLMVDEFYNMVRDDLRGHLNEK